MVVEYLAIIKDENFPLVRYITETFCTFGIRGGYNKKEEMYDEWIDDRIDLILSLFHSFQYLDEVMESVHKVEPKPCEMKREDIHCIERGSYNYTLSSLAITSFLLGCEIKAITYRYYDDYQPYVTVQQCYYIVPSKHSLKLCNTNKFIKYVYELSFDLYLYEIGKYVFFRPFNVIYTLLINTSIFLQHYTELDSEAKSIIDKYEAEHQCLLI